MDMQNKNKKILDKTDRLTIVLMLSFINLLLFIIYFKDLASLGVLSRSIGELNGASLSYVLGIVYGIFAIVLYIVSFWGIVPKYERFTSAVITICMILIACLILTYSIVTLKSNGSLSVANSGEDSIDSIANLIGVVVLVELIFPVLITIVNAVLIKNVGESYSINDKDSQIENKPQTENGKFLQDAYEKEILSKIEKVRYELRIKELEKEYTNLQSQLKNSDKDK